MHFFLADENFPYGSYKLLLNEGIDVKHIMDEGLSSINDKEVIRLSLEEERIIVTFDSDFGELIFRQAYKPIGVIYFRWHIFEPNEPGKYILDLLNSKALPIKGYLTVIDRHKVRQRKI